MTAEKLKTAQIELHPLCTLFPRMQGPEFDALCADILANGLRQQIVLHDGMILDGGNRYRACLQAGVRPDFEVFAGSSPVAFVLSANLHRRHMTVGQQAAIVASAQDWAKAQPQGRNTITGNVAGDTVASRREQSGASDRTQRMADSVARQSPELARDVAHGTLSLPAAVKQLSPPPKPVQPPAPKPAQAPAQEAEDTTDDEPSLREQLHEAQDVAAELAAEVETLRAAGSVEGAEAEIGRLRAMLRAVEAERDMYRTKSTEMLAQIKAMQRKIATLERAK